MVIGIACAFAVTNSAFMGWEGSIAWPGPMCRMTPIRAVFGVIVRSFDPRAARQTSAALKGTDMSKVAIQKTKSGTTHVLATCLDCPEVWDDYKTADAEARRHAETTGHAVSVERAQCWTYRSR